MNHIKKRNDWYIFEKHLDHVQVFKFIESQDLKYGSLSVTSLFTRFGDRVAVASKKANSKRWTILNSLLSATDIFWNQTLVCDKTVHLWQEKLLIWIGCQIWLISWIISSQSLHLRNISNISHILSITFKLSLCPYIQNYINTDISWISFILN